MGREGVRKDWVVAVTCCFFVGLVAAANYRCYDCASLLSPESSCETGPDFNSSTKCKTYCYTDVTTQAGVRSNIKRGCTPELECAEESTCRELSRTGPCRSCCLTHLCNDDSPDDLGFVSTWVSKDAEGGTVARSGAVAVWGGGRRHHLTTVMTVSLMGVALATTQWY